VKEILVEVLDKNDQGVSTLIGTVKVPLQTITQQPSPFIQSYPIKLSSKISSTSSPVLNLKFTHNWKVERNEPPQVLGSEAESTEKKKKMEEEELQLMRKLEFEKYEEKQHLMAEKEAASMGSRNFLQASEVAIWNPLVFNSVFGSSSQALFELLNCILDDPPSSPQHIYPLQVPLLSFSDDPPPLLFDIRSKSHHYCRILLMVPFCFFFFLLASLLIFPKHKKCR
jgi:hypothetical protein